jgi:hypothetical protein
MMHKAVTMLVFASVATMSAALAGCNDLIGLTPGTPRGDGGTTGSGGTGGTGGTGGSGGAPICVPSQTSTPVDDACGVFVSASKGSDGNAGTKDGPFATIQKALAASTGKPIYLCDEIFAEAVELKADEVIYGALDCLAGWTYSGANKPTVIAPPSDAVPLRVAAGLTAELYDLDLRAADATATGGSSIGLIAAEGASVSVSRCTVEAGDGQSGLVGAPYMSAAAAGQVGSDGGAACSAKQVLAPNPPVSDCGALMSIGGYGGFGPDIGNPAPGNPGEPLSDMNQNGGLGESASPCTAGKDGWFQPIAEPGDGATGLGTLDAKSGYIGVAGMDGKEGAPGQGGGGGGGSKGGTGTGKCPDASKAGGASGGDGGSGGCGGLGGKGGQPGGASIGILSINAKLSFSAVTITTKSGAKGGDGGAGQQGGKGGPGGNGGSAANYANLHDGCAGGKGGSGGQGGTGGGGRGGHSIGIAYTGDMPSTAGASITVGSPGDGGKGEGDKGNGLSGVAQKVQAFN